MSFLYDSIMSVSGDHDQTMVGIFPPSKADHYVGQYEAGEKWGYSRRLGYKPPQERPAIYPPLTKDEKERILAFKNPYHNHDEEPDSTNESIADDWFERYFDYMDWTGELACQSMYPTGVNASTFADTAQSSCSISQRRPAPSDAPGVSRPRRHRRALQDLSAYQRYYPPRARVGPASDENRPPSKYNLRHGRYVASQQATSRQKRRQA